MHLTTGLLRWVAFGERDLIKEDCCITSIVKKKLLEIFYGWYIFHCVHKKYICIYCKHTITHLLSVHKLMQCRCFVINWINGSGTKIIFFSMFKPGIYKYSFFVFDLSPFDCVDVMQVVGEEK